LPYSSIPEAMSRIPSSLWINSAILNHETDELAK
jgi:hypothetical protein